jgi:hypothetical protein
MKRFETGCDHLEFGFSPGALFSVQSLQEGVHFLPAVIPSADFGNTPLIAFLVETKSGFDLCDDHGRVSHRGNLLNPDSITGQVNSREMGYEFAGFFWAQISRGVRNTGTTKRQRKNRKDENADSVHGHSFRRNKLQI